MARLKTIIEDTKTPGGKLFDLTIQALIVLSLISFSIETLPDLAPGTQALLANFEVFCIGVFTLEYLGRIWVADDKLKYPTSFFGIVDLLAILPFYLSTGLDLRSLRAFRLLRLVRILKLARYSEAVQRFHIAFKMAREELLLFASTTAIILYLTGVGIYYFEHAAQPDKFSSVFQSLWWAVASLTAVGYGDVYPITVGGKVFTAFILLIGLGVVSIPAAIMAAALSNARDQQDSDDDLK